MLDMTRESVYSVKNMYSTKSACFCQGKWVQKIQDGGNTQTTDWSMCFVALNEPLGLRVWRRCLRNV